MKPTKRSLERFEYFLQCQDALRLPAIVGVGDGVSAAEAFHDHETFGKIPPCREPEMLARALNGKERHGMTVTMVAEDYVGRIMFGEDLDKYPEWVKKDIIGRAGQIAMKTIGFVPTFVKTGKDFTNSEFRL
jgi:hypothetical protein